MTRRLPAVLLPPSKSQRGGGSGTPWAPGSGAVPSLDGARSRVLQSLADMASPAASHDELARCFGATGATLDAAIEANRTVFGSATMPAIQRFDGVLYDELAYADRHVVVRRRIDAMVLIFDAAFGVLSPRDPIPLHRLDFHARLPHLGAERLAVWWRPQLTAAMATHLRGRVVWDLLPTEHASAWDPSEVPLETRYTVSFVDAKGKTVSHWNKLLKGSLAAWLCEHAPTRPQQLMEFEHPLGYRLDRAATTERGGASHLVFRET